MYHKKKIPDIKIISFEQLIKDNLMYYEDLIKKLNIEAIIEYSYEQKLDNLTIQLNRLQFKTFDYEYLDDEFMKFILNIDEMIFKLSGLLYDCE